MDRKAPYNPGCNNFNFMDNQDDMATKWVRNHTDSQNFVRNCLSCCNIFIDMGDYVRVAYLKTSLCDYPESFSIFKEVPLPNEELYKWTLLFVVVCVFIVNYFTRDNTAMKEVSTGIKNVFPEKTLSIYVMNYASHLKMI